MKYGKVELNHNLVLAPMAGITDMSYRTLCSEQGAELSYTEMVSAKAIYYGNKKTEPLLNICDEEAPVIVQLFGSEPDLMGEMAKRIEDRGFVGIDVNMGCPVPKIVNNGEGSALMKDPVLIGKIVESMVKAVSLPVSIKIRAGFDNNKNAAEVAKVAEASGASMIAVHGRTREQYYAGRSDWDCIRKVKEAVHIPVIGSGDVTDGESAKKMFEKTGCDAIMIGRAARGNPWIFQEIIHYMETGEKYGEPTTKEIMSMIRRHANLLCIEKGEEIATREMRKHIAWYTTGLPFSSRLREQVNKQETFDDLIALLENYNVRKGE